MRRALVLLSLGLATSAHAEEISTPTATPPTSAPTSAFTLAEYLAEVAKGNLELQAQRFDISVAEAQVEVARVFPDGTLTAGVGSYEISSSGSPTAVAVALDVPIEIAGKRGRRIDAASEQLKITQSTFADAMRTLRRDAANDFIDAIHARLVRDRKQQTLTGLQKLIAYNEEALRVGQVGEVALVQSRVEARKFEAELGAAEAGVHQADLQLALRMGRDGRVSLPGTPTANLKAQPHQFQLETLMSEARSHRPDLLSAKQAIDAAQAQIALARTNRWTDLTIGAGYSHGFPGVEPNYPNVPFDTVSLTLGVTLPFSRLFFQGDVTAAEQTAQKAASTAKATEHAIEIEIEAAMDRYRSAEEVVARYDKGILADSEKVLSANFYNYQRGGISQLEVIAAQRDLDGVYLAYYDALQERAKALIAVEQAADIWDLTF
jgi:cobalt-zinc-cadmium efflux system outer membrane protein